MIAKYNILKYTKYNIIYSSKLLTKISNRQNYISTYCPAIYCLDAIAVRKFVGTSFELSDFQIQTMSDSLPRARSRSRRAGSSYKESERAPPQKQWWETRVLIKLDSAMHSASFGFRKIKFPISFI